MTTLLVVDDSPVNQFLARSIFEPFGYNVITASGGSEALALAREHPPDMIVSDVNMGRESGFDLLKEVKADGRLSQIPFVFLSCTAWRNVDREKGLALGADQYIVRPIENQILLTMIKACFRKNRERSHAWQQS